MTVTALEIQSARDGLILVAKVLEDLQQEVERLQALRTALAEAGLVNGSSNGGSPVRRIPQEVVQPALSKVVLEILRKMPDSDMGTVYAKLQARGFKITGKTPLRRRLHVQMSDLLKQGHVRRRRGRYSVTRKGEQTA
jgi:hypothetical protein